MRLEKEFTSLKIAFTKSKCCFHSYQLKKLDIFSNKNLNNNILVDDID